MTATHTQVLRLWLRLLIFAALAGLASGFLEGPYVWRAWGFVWWSVVKYFALFLAIRTAIYVAILEVRLFDEGGRHAPPREESSQG